MNDESLVEKHIFGDEKDFVSKQKSSSAVKVYDQLCYGLPLALRGREFNEVEARCVSAFLMTLRYDFQHINTLRAIFVYMNDGEIRREWVNYLMGDEGYTNYFWTEMKEIKSRIHDSQESTTMLDTIIKVLFKRKDRR